MKYPDIFRDEKYRMCIGLATLSKGISERYGAILVSVEGEIIGRGYNRSIAHASFPGIRLQRRVRQGYANHAEGEATDEGLSSGKPVIGANMYVAGYFPSDRGLFLHSTFTCVKCAKMMDQWGIASVFVPSAQGWVERPVAIALEEARLSLVEGKGKHEKRRNLTEGRYFLDQLSLA